MGRLLEPCWSCGATTRDCLGGCECARCVNPDDYAMWRTENPEEYAAWIEDQRDQAEGNPSRREAAKQAALIKRLMVIRRIRLAKGAAILGRLWREGARSACGWTGECRCVQKTEFCQVKMKWLAILTRFRGGCLPARALDGPAFVLQAMDAEQLAASGLVSFLEMMLRNERNEPSAVVATGGTLPPLPTLKSFLASRFQVAADGSVTGCFLCKWIYEDLEAHGELTDEKKERPGDPGKGLFPRDAKIAHLELELGVAHLEMP